jgi:hypothetical protein
MNMLFTLIIIDNHEMITIINIMNINIYRYLIQGKFLRLLIIKRWLPHLTIKCWQEN